MTAATVPLTAPALAVRSTAAIRPVVAAEKAGVTDEVLFARALAGNREALGMLVANYEKSLFSLLTRLTNGDRHRADDLFQETFLHAMRAGDTFDRKMAFKPWIMAIAVNLVRDDARKRKTRGEVPLEGGVDDTEYERACVVAAGDETPGEHAERCDEEHCVQRALQRLTLLEREVVLLHFYDNMTLAETAAALGVALGTVKSRLHAALKRLSRMLDKPQE
ncbi:MAG: RNA polymerase sigma factor [Planctomycetota bacterium]|nr:RNA polymerase sigma factor [Planctomycetota bacterium]